MIDTLLNLLFRCRHRGNCNFDVRHQTNTSLIWVSPSAHDWRGRLLGNWQLAPILSAHSGLPIDIRSGTDISQTGIGLDRPYLVGSSPYLTVSDPRYYLSRAAFQVQAAGTFGNLGRNVLTAPASVNFDLSVSRRFHINERWQLEARAEGFNVINHTNFNGPTTGLNSSTFGVISSAGDPRILQFAMKLHF